MNNLLPLIMLMSALGDKDKAPIEAIMQIGKTLGIDDKALSAFASGKKPTMMDILPLLQAAGGSKNNEKSPLSHKNSAEETPAPDFDFIKSYVGDETANALLDYFAD